MTRVWALSFLLAGCAGDEWSDTDTRVVANEYCRLNCAIEYLCLTDRCTWDEEWRWGPCPTIQEWDFACEPARRHLVLECMEDVLTMAEAGTCTGWSHCRLLCVEPR